MRISFLFLLFLFLVTPVSAQLRFETSAYGGYPLMLTGDNTFSKITPTVRGTWSYQAAASPLLPYITISTSAITLPLQSKQTKLLSQSLLATSFILGLNRQIRYSEQSTSEWHAGGGIGLTLLRPLSATLNINGQESKLGYTELMGNAWFPKAEGNLRWIKFPMNDWGFYIGALVITEVFWLRDTKTRYTTSITGTAYSLNFNSLILMPSIGAIIGCRF